MMEARRLLPYLLLLLLPSLATAQQSVDEEQEDYFKRWLDQDVRYIISFEEKEVFSRLSTAEEKERFVEQFWRRRDTDPETRANEFKEEHYRRIAYANERFKSGRDGWLTDRGRLYIIHGPPSNIEMHPMGGLYMRPLNEGGGSTTTFPYEVWSYRYIEGLGTDIQFEFVDAGMNGAYKLALSPDEKDALLMAGGGATLEEQMGSKTRGDRVREQYLLRPLDHRSLGIRRSSFQILEDYFTALSPPKIKFRDLQKMVGTRISYEELPIATQASLFWIAEDRFVVPVTLQVFNRELSYKPEGMRNKARVEVYGAVHDLSGRIQYEFEDQIYVDDPGPGQLAQRGRSIYQHPIPLKSGRYKIEWVVRDVHSGKIGTSRHVIVAPRQVKGQMFFSPLVLADRIRFDRDANPLAPFATLSGLKVYPNLQDNSFYVGNKIGVYFELYNFAVDAASGEPDLRILLRILDQAKREIKQLRLDEMGMTFLGDRAAVSTLLYLENSPGEYRLHISIHDAISDQKEEIAERFRIREEGEDGQRVAASQ